MQNFPHSYSVTATSSALGDVDLTTDGVARLSTDAPASFDGPGDRWSPETLLVAAVGDCFALTFRAVARASNLAWTSLICDVTGALDRVDRVPQFTAFEVRAILTVPAGTNVDAAGRVLAKAERGCLVANSLKAPVHLTPFVTVAVDAPAHA